MTGRSLLMFVLKPEDSPGDGDNAMERSYQHVMQAFERANVETVRFHLDARTEGRGREFFATPGLACLARGGAPANSTAPRGPGCARGPLACPGCPVRGRRGGRVDEGARLESVYTGNGIAGSNPAPSARPDLSAASN